jgi:hypothetical protein
MAYRTLAGVLANNETQSQILPGLVQKYLTTNEYLAWANTIVTEKPSITIPYIADYGTVQKGITSLTSYTSVAISGGNDVFSLVKYGTQFETANDIIGLGSSFVDQAAEDLLGAVKRMADQLAIDSIVGTGSGEIYGLNTLCTSTTVASGAGGAGDVSSIWSLFDTVKAKSDKMALVMNAKTKRAVMKAVMSASNVATMELKGTSFLVPVFNGAAILTNDSCTDGDIFLVNGATDEGTFLAIGNYPGQSVGGLFNYTSVGVHQSVDTNIYRLNGHFAQIRKSRQGISKISSWI